jgi:Ca2+-binding RTX toxin-like protein
VATSATFSLSRRAGTGLATTVFRGNGGADTAYGGTGIDRLFGGDSVDTLVGGAGADLLYGGNETDILFTGIGADRVFGGDGIDRADFSLATAGFTVDLVTGHAGRIRIFSIEDVVGTSFADNLYGGAGNDSFGAEGGNDTLRGNAGDDLLSLDQSGVQDDDVAYGGSGNDYVYTNGGSDRVFGGAGRDYLQIANTHDITLRLATRAATVDLGVDGTLTISGFEDLNTSNGDDQITGTRRANTIITYGGDDSLNGKGGVDYLDGGTGNDVILGGGGADVLTGGVGVDRLTGGSGADEFHFARVIDSSLAGPDAITDFELTSDVIDLSFFEVVLPDDTTRIAAFTFIDAGPFSGFQDELRFASGQLQGDTDGDGLADFVLLVSGVASIGLGNLDL